MSDEFKAWVEKWQIGPGMNDNPRTNEFLVGLGGKLNSTEMLELQEKKLYSGFDGSVGEGWIPILDRLVEDLVKLGWDKDLHQVKEKFGGLRFYIGAGSEEIHERIKQAERECEKTCELCGAPGKIEGPGWLKCLCKSCRGKRNAR